MRVWLLAMALMGSIGAAQAQGISVSVADTITSVAAAQKGKRVTLRLRSGQEITGTLREATDKLVVLGELSGREFFDAAVPVADGHTGSIPYPTLTRDFHYEIELVVAIGKGGSHIAAADAVNHIYGYAVGLDMTRRDLQSDMKKAGRPWSIGKGFDHSAPIGPIHPRASTGEIQKGGITLKVNGQMRQNSDVSLLIWNVAETIEQLSKGWTLQPGDLIFTGTPAGIGPVVSGDVMEGAVDGLGTLRVAVA